MTKTRPKETLAALVAPARLGRVAVLLAAGGIAVLFVSLVVDVVSSRGLFEYAAIDFRVWWSVGHVAAEDGFAHVYDLERLESYQRHLFFGYSLDGRFIPFRTFPMPYPSVFATPFVLLSQVSPIKGYVFWALLNVAGYVFYLRRVSRAMALTPDDFVMACAFSCLPLLLNLLFAQVNLWLLICMGEMLIAAHRGQGLRSGLWLGGLLMKPQVLVLFGLGLLIARRFRVLAGLALAGVLVALASFGLSGPQGIADWLAMLRDYKSDFGSFPESMMNWRMLAINLESHELLGTGAAWAVAYLGMAASVAAVVWCWLGRVTLDANDFTYRVLATYAATCAFTWHAQVHMALPLIVPLIVLRMRGQLSLAALAAWSLVPSGAFLLLRPPHLKAALAMLALNLVLVVLAVVFLSRSAPPVRPSLTGAVSDWAEWAREARAWVAARRAGGTTAGGSA